MKLSFVYLFILVSSQKSIVRAIVPDYTLDTVSRCGWSNDRSSTTVLHADANSDGDNVTDTVNYRKDNKAMAFLRRKGIVGQTKAQDFINAMGVDEGPVGKSFADNVSKEGMKVSSSQINEG